MNDPRSSHLPKVFEHFSNSKIGTVISRIMFWDEVGNVVNNYNMRLKNI